LQHWLQCNRSCLDGTRISPWQTTGHFSRTLRHLLAGGLRRRGWGSGGFRVLSPNDSPDAFSHLGHMALRVFWLIFGAAMAVVTSWIVRETPARKVWNCSLAVAAGVAFFACLVFLSEVTGLPGTLGVPLSALAYLGIVAAGAHASRFLVGD